MAEEQERPNPGSFGIEALIRELKEFRQHLDQLLATQHRETHSLLTYQHREAHAASRRIEGQLKKMADQFDGLRQLISEQSTAIQQEASQINAKLDAQLVLIGQLQDTINQGVPVPQDLADALKANTVAVQGFIPDTVPDPVPDPGPPARRR